MSNEKPKYVKDFPVMLPQENYDFIIKMKKSMDSKNKNNK